MTGPEETPTETALPRRPSAPSDSPDEGRFPPGTLLAQRYRIVSLLGRGGMGEVYRATDLLLGQTVALKFLPAAAAGNEAALNRFRNEVRTARLVSHPNVCRVFDIGEAEGLTYLSMEYVDGEDLRSLLHRIGKVPQDKALEIARKLCAGLAAAHDKGVIHRDLKPANIMLDGQGQVRITDFGLAGFAEQVRDVRSGTPAYMAPEQKAGMEVTARSDIYSLGMVLHEVFTGKRPSESSKTELDPAVDRVIQRCLDQNPESRPPTALAVSASLPGGDPLAMALAAGETPTPAMVANAGDVEGLRVPVAAACLASIVAGLIGLCFLLSRRDLVNRIPLDDPPEALAAKAREIAKSFGYGERPGDTASGWSYDEEYLGWLRRQQDGVERWTRLGANRPPAIRFWYRESPHDLSVLLGEGVTPADPPQLDPGMADVLLDSEGRLVGFEGRAQPPPGGSGRAAPALDWSRLFVAAGLDPAGFTPCPPQEIPRSFADVRAAWKGAWPGAPADALRLEAAAFQGRLVSFKIIGPWSRPSPGPAEISMPGWFRVPSFTLFAVILPVVASMLARRNARLGRGDRRGAFRLAGFVFLLVLAEHLLKNDHVSGSGELVILIVAFSHSVLVAIILWVLYMAFEPSVRRRSPETLISWNRLLAGKWRDPLAGADLLAGVLLGVITRLLSALAPAAVALNRPFPRPELPAAAGVSVALWAQSLWTAAVFGLGCVLLLNLLRVLGRRRWAAAALFVAFRSLVALPGPVTASPVLAALAVSISSLEMYALSRFGILSFTALLFVDAALRIFPLTTQLAAWHARSGMLAMLGVLALAVYAFHTTLAGRPLWRDAFREE